MYTQKWAIQGNTNMQDKRKNILNPWYIILWPLRHQILILTNYLSTGEYPRWNYVSTESDIYSCNILAFINGFSIKPSHIFSIKK